MTYHTLFLVAILGSVLLSLAVLIILIAALGWNVLLVLGAGVGAFVLLAVVGDTISNHRHSL